MNKRATKAFTMLEMLVVIVIILILASLAFPVIMQVNERVKKTKCASNLKQCGTWVIQEAMARGAFPRGGGAGISPGQWGSVYGNMIADLGNHDVARCPSAKNNSMNPTTHSWASCSYAYVGHLSPTYMCTCGACDTGKEIWRLYWSGVNYTGDHDESNFDKFADLKLADNLAFAEDRVDAGEAASPTIPEHQDTEAFSASDREKDRSLRALREIPEGPEDMKRKLPLLMDIVVWKADTLADIDAAMSAADPGSSGWEWKASQLDITENDKYDILYANHCNTSASSRKGWGINIFYSDNSVQWKDWDELRFQVMDKEVGDDSNKNHLYFY